MRRTIVYHGDGTKTEYVGKHYSETFDHVTASDTNYHDHINKTYYQLEVEGKLNDMSAREKQRTRDLHILAQDSRYWDE